MLLHASFEASGMQPAEDTNHTKTGHTTADDPSRWPQWICEHCGCPNRFNRHNCRVPMCRKPKPFADVIRSKIIKLEAKKRYFQKKLLSIGSSLSPIDDISDTEIETIETSADADTDLTDLTNLTEAETEKELTKETPECEYSQNPVSPEDIDETESFLIPMSDDDIYDTTNEIDTQIHDTDDTQDIDESIARELLPKNLLDWDHDVRRCILCGCFDIHELWFWCERCQWCGNGVGERL